MSSQMNKFVFFFGLVLGEMLLRHTDNLNRTRQSKRHSAAEGKVAAAMTTDTLAVLEVRAVWKKVSRMTDEVDVDEPELPRKRKRPARYETGRSSS